MGEDSEECFEGINALLTITGETEQHKNSLPQEVDISKEKYTNLFKSWREALILKVLRKTVSFNVLEQRTCDL